MKKNLGNGEGELSGKYRRGGGGGKGKEWTERERRSEGAREARFFRYLSQSTPAVSFLHLSFDVHANRSCS